IIASGTSNRQTRAIASNVADAARKQKVPIVAYEGEDTGEWVLIDLGDIVVHCMQPQVRQYYNLEEIWGGKPVRVKLLPQSTQPSIPGSYDDFDDYNDDSTPGAP